MDRIASPLNQAAKCYDASIHLFRCEGKPRFASLSLYGLPKQQIIGKVKPSKNNETKQVASYLKLKRSLKPWASIVGWTGGHVPLLVELEGTICLPLPSSGCEEMDVLRCSVLLVFYRSI